MKKILTAVLFAAALVSFGLPAMASEADTIKKNMMERLSKIDAMKDKGLIGEDNKGYLGVVGAALSDEDAAVVNAENKDRQSVYTAIAKQQAATVEVVGQRRAIQNAKNAKVGTYIMDDKGKWVKKQPEK